MVAVVGPSGCGKSLLASQLKRNQASCLNQSQQRGSSRSDNHRKNTSATSKPLWCAGKFDQQHTQDPYEAISHALSSLIENSEPQMLDEWKKAIEKTLGEETSILMEMIPAVAVFLRKGGHSSDDTDGIPVKDRETEFASKNIDVGFKVCQGCHFVPRNTFFVGLFLVLAYMVDGKARRLKTASLMKRRLKAWLKIGNPNVLHFLHLLRAELKYSRQDFAAARDQYMAAIKVSMRTGYKLDYAVSNELLSLFHADAANPLHSIHKSQHHMRASIDSYEAYGAANKVRYMKLKHANILESVTSSHFMATATVNNKKDNF